MPTRFRSRSYTVPCVFPQVQNWSYPAGQLISTLPAYIGNVETVVETMADVVTPKFKRLSQEGSILNNEMTQNKDITSLARIYFDLERISGNTRYTVMGNAYLHGLPLLATPGVPALDSSLVDQAITEAHAKVKLADVDLTVMAVEMGETLRLIHSTGRKFLKIYKGIRKFNARAIRDAISISAVRDQWLEYRYGMRPLYYDLRGVYNYLKRWGKVAPRYTARSNPSVLTASGKSTGSLTAYVIPSSGAFTFTVSYERWTEQSQTVRAGVLYAVDFSDAFTKQLALLGVDRPLSSAWDLIPFSFVADWFIGIGPFIASWEPKPGCNMLASWYTATRQASAITKVIGATLQYPPWVKSNLTFLTRESRRDVKVVNRKVNPSLPVLPSFAIKLNPAKLLDLAAIFLRLK